MEEDARGLTKGLTNTHRSVATGGTSCLRDGSVLDQGKGPEGIRILAVREEEHVAVVDSYGRYWITRRVLVWSRSESLLSAE